MGFLKDLFGKLGEWGFEYYKFDSEVVVADLVMTDKSYAAEPLRRVRVFGSLCGKYHEVSAPCCCSKGRSDS